MPFRPLDRNASAPFAHRGVICSSRARGDKNCTCLYFGGGYYNTDQFRHAIERMGAVEYLSTSYYERWLSMLETLLIRTRRHHKAGTQRQARATQQGSQLMPVVVTKDFVPELVSTGGSTRVHKAVAPRFRVGPILARWLAGNRPE
jgi:hypothetical protein